jgi:hypothetical protein
LTSDHVLKTASTQATVHTTQTRIFKYVCIPTAKEQAGRCDLLFFWFVYLESMSTLRFPVVAPSLFFSRLNNFCGLTTPKKPLKQGQQCLSYNHICHHSVTSVTTSVKEFNTAHRSSVCQRIQLLRYHLVYWVCETCILSPNDSVIIARTLVLFEKILFAYHTCGQVLLCLCGFCSFTYVAQVLAGHSKSLCSFVQS